MEIPTPSRTFLKVFAIVLIIELIIAYTVFQIIAYTNTPASICLHGYTGAPVAQPAPAASQIGKVGFFDRGGSIFRSELFEHNVYFPIRDGDKLIPGLGIHPACTILEGKTIECLADRVKRNSI